MPDSFDLTNEKVMKYIAGRTPGRVQLFDEHGEKIGKKMIAFDNIGSFVEVICKQWRKMFLKKTKK